MERQAATDTDPRTLDFTQGLTTVVFVERSAGGSRGTAPAVSGNCCERCPREAAPWCLARLRLFWVPSINTDETWLRVAV